MSSSSEFGKVSTARQNSTTSKVLFFSFLIASCIAIWYPTLVNYHDARRDIIHWLSLARNNGLKLTGEFSYKAGLGSYWDAPTSFLNPIAVGQHLCPPSLSMFVGYLGGSIVVFAAAYCLFRQVNSDDFLALLQSILLTYLILFPSQFRMNNMVEFAGSQWSVCLAAWMLLLAASVKFMSGKFSLLQLSMTIGVVALYLALVAPTWIILVGLSTFPLIVSISWNSRGTVLSSFGQSLLYVSSMGGAAILGVSSALLMGSPLLALVFSARSISRNVVSEVDNFYGPVGDLYASLSAASNPIVRLGMLILVLVSFILNRRSTDPKILFLVRTSLSFLVLACAYAFAYTVTYRNGIEIGVKPAYMFHFLQVLWITNICIGIVLGLGKVSRIVRILSAHDLASFWNRLGPRRFMIPWLALGLWCFSNLQLFTSASGLNFQISPPERFVQSLHKNSLLGSLIPTDATLLAIETATSVEGERSRTVSTGGPIFDELFGLDRDDSARFVNLYSHYIPPASADFFSRNLTQDGKLSQNFLSASRFDGKSVQKLGVTHVISNLEVKSDLVKRVSSGRIKQRDSAWHLYEVNELPNIWEDIELSNERITVDLPPIGSPTTIVLPTTFSYCNRVSLVGDYLSKDEKQLGSYSSDGLQSITFSASLMPRRLIVSRIERGIEFITCQIRDITHNPKMIP